MLYVLKLNPAFLIANTKYKEQHTAIINYLLSAKEEQKLASILSSSELSHIRDVHNLIAKIPITLFFLLVLTSFFIKKYQNISFNEVVKYSIILLLLLIVLGTIAFMPLFVLFHQIFFPQGNWSFPENSILIQLYPDSFWQRQGLLLVITIILEIASFFLFRKNRSFTSQKPFMI